MSNKILVFHEGQKIGVMKREDLEPRKIGEEIQLVSINLDGKDVDVLYLFSMDYAIIISNDTADIIRRNSKKEVSDEQNS